MNNPKDALDVTQALEWFNGLIEKCKWNNSEVTQSDVLSSKALISAETIRTALEGSVWHDISTAPKHKSVIVYYHATVGTISRQAMLGDDNLWFFMSGSGKTYLMGLYTPKGWTEIPTPPTNGEV